MARGHVTKLGLMRQGSRRAHDGQPRPLCALHSAALVVVISVNALPLYCGRGWR
jgi:hypothetical protein